jgi:hypothetical protein
MPQKLSEEQLTHLLAGLEAIEFFKYHDEDREKITVDDLLNLLPSVSDVEDLVEFYRENVDRLASTTVPDEEHYR